MQCWINYAAWYRWYGEMRRFQMNEARQCWWQYRRKVIYWNVQINIFHIITSRSGKVLLTVMLSRINSQREIFIAEEQGCFRGGRSTVKQILSLRPLAEKQWKRNAKVLNCFVDYRKAFDSVWHTGLWAVMKWYGVVQKLIKLTNAVYDNQICSTSE